MTSHGEGSPWRRSSFPRPPGPYGKCSVDEEERSMNEFELIVAILDDLDRRICNIEGNSGESCRSLIERLRKVTPTERPRRVER